MVFILSASCIGGKPPSFRFAINTFISSSRSEDESRSLAFEIQHKLDPPKNRPSENLKKFINDYSHAKTKLAKQKQNLIDTNILPQTSLTAMEKAAQINFSHQQISGASNDRKNNYNYCYMAPVILTASVLGGHVYFLPFLAIAIPVAIFAGIANLIDLAITKVRTSSLESSFNEEQQLAGGWRERSLKDGFFRCELEIKSKFNNIDGVVTTMADKKSPLPQLRPAR